MRTLCINLSDTSAFLYHHCASFGRPMASIERSLWRPLCLHSATTATLEPQWQWFCLHSAFFARPVVPLQQPWSFKEGTRVVLQQLHRNRTFWVPATTERPNHFYGRTKVAQRSQPCVKGALLLQHDPCAFLGRPKLLQWHNSSRKEGRVKAEPLPLWLKCCRGRWMEAQCSPQWSLNGRHWSAKGGTMVVQGRQTCRSNWYTMFAFFTERPMADHCASILRPRRCVCLHPASFERPTSSVTFLRLFGTCSKLHGDHGVHGHVWTSCVPTLNDQGNCSASLLPWTATWPVLWSHKGGTKVAAPVQRGYYVIFWRICPYEGTALPHIQHTRWVSV